MHQHTPATSNTTPQTKIAISTVHLDACTKDERRIWPQRKRISQCSLRASRGSQTNLRALQPNQDELPMWWCLRRSPPLHELGRFTRRAGTLTPAHHWSNTAHNVRPVRGAHPKQFPFSVICSVIYGWRVPCVCSASRSVGSLSIQTRTINWSPTVYMQFSSSSDLIRFMYDGLPRSGSAFPQERAVWSALSVCWQTCQCILHVCMVLVMVK